MRDPHSTVIWRGSQVLLAAAALWGIASGALRESFFASDELYVPTLFEDLFAWSGTFRAWRLTPAPYFFPDLPLYAAARLISGAVEPAQYAAGIGLLVLFAGAAHGLLRALTPDARIAPSMIGLLLLALLILHIQQRLPLFGVLICVSDHGGGALITPLILTLCIERSCSHGRIVSLIAASLCFVTGLSDPLFAASCGVPLLVIGVAAALPSTWSRYWAASEAARRRLRDRALVSGLAAVGGARLTAVVHAHMNALPVTAAPSPSWAALRALLLDLAGPSLAAGVGLLLGVAVAVVILVRCRAAATSGGRVLASWQLLSIAATVAAITWMGHYGDSGSLRYVVIPFSMVPVMFCALLAQAPERWAAHPFALRALALLRSLVVASLIAALVTAPLLLTKQYQSRWRDTAACVNAVLEREHVDVLLAEYWYAKPLLLFSNRHVRALQVSSKLNGPYYWINSRAWYRGQFAFGVVAANGMKAKALAAKLHQPARVESCNDVVLNVYAGAARERLRRRMQRLFDDFVADSRPGE